ncbi:MAG: DUF1499 domain-containing protein [gamma proteobacterium symbiont of Bathyaustriella thionipta]|nr:DUF1499 domain-containing protein [gamma proteobacterium symbiont of Bathyaustriella thionipta]MCU7951711.1 DUF1499 domain-containing protein [gamma proteobacterium symbiont of Bathyaustriella thionipta]MCU7958310.1 DUF1499 domain-containing protein [gamma proteobacterium symbiont of Bathyaustriella thionipta]MCU7967859.1 DUF1499 domain-containing protein [gamma proteobacterium symbiont of Bathyaustriella thionipta]
MLNSYSLGIIDGRLVNCPDKPNCINSEYPEQGNHYLPPLNIPKAKSTEIMTLAKITLLEMGAKIIKSENNYLLASFTSNLFRFVDDFELRLDKTTYKLHIRSASRVGYSDFGVNKRRVERFIKLINNKL